MNSIILQNFRFFNLSLNFICTEKYLLLGPSFHRKTNNVLGKVKQHNDLFTKTHFFWMIQEI